MIILTIRGDNPEAEIGLFNDQDKISYDKWTAHRELAETIHKRIDNLLKENNLTLNNLNGVVAYQGPGSFTGLRISLSVANALADSLGIKIIGSTGDDWIVDGVTKLIVGESDKLVIPEYGAPVHITQPRK